MGLPALQIMKENKGEKCYGKSPLLFLPLVFTLRLVCAAGCVNEGNSTEMSATTKTTTTTKSSSYGSYGSDYDNRVDEAANIFGEDPDHVNDVYEALGNAMW